MTTLRCYENVVEAGNSVIAHCIAVVYHLSRISLKPIFPRTQILCSCPMNHPMPLFISRAGKLARSCMCLRASQTRVRAANCEIRVLMRPYCKNETRAPVSIGFPHRSQLGEDMQRSRLRGHALIGAGVNKERVPKDYMRTIAANALGFAVRARVNIVNTYSNTIINS